MANLTEEQRDELGRQSREEWLRYNKEHAVFEDDTYILSWEHLNEADRKSYRVAAVAIYEKGYDEGFRKAMSNVFATLNKTN